MLRITQSVIIACLVAGASLAQNPQAEPKAAQPIRWAQDLKESVEQAKKSKLPLMLWVQGSSSDRNEMDKLERDQQRVFAMARVVEAAKRFVPVKISRARYKKELQEWGIGERVNLDLVFITADGEKLGELSAGGVANADSLIQKLGLVFGEYRNKIYEKSVKPDLQNEKATAKQQLAALDTVIDYRIASADRDILALLKRGGLDGPVTQKCYAALAKISSKDAVAELFDRAANDKRAAEALDDCNAGGADAILPFLDEQQDGEKFVRAYKVICKICKIGNAKNDKFWSGKNEKVKLDEVKRVKDRATKAVADWKEKHEVAP